MRKKAAPEEAVPVETTPLTELAFQYPLRKYQLDIIELVKSKFASGERQLHIVAPPGAGKTIIGLQLISTFQVPSLILSPNTTIQSQWGEKVHLFLPPEVAPFKAEGLIGTHEDKPLKPITLLTYQVLSTPGKELEFLTKQAHKSWVEELMKSRGLSMGDAEIRILDLLQNNPKAHHQEMSRHVSRLRKRLTEVLDLKDVLHENALQLLRALKRQKFEVIIFDECHHLTDYWAAIMTHLVQYLGDPIIIGLTGTPPENKSASQENRYLSLVGEIDYQVPTPALVREGGLAPFQDLVYFSEPTKKELSFLEQQHEEFHSLIDELINGVPPSTKSTASSHSSPTNGQDLDGLAADDGDDESSDMDYVVAYDSSVEDLDSRQLAAEVAAARKNKQSTKAKSRQNPNSAIVTEQPQANPPLRPNPGKRDQHPASLQTLTAKNELAAFPAGGADNGESDEQLDNAAAEISTNAVPVAAADFPTQVGVGRPNLTYVDPITAPTLVVRESSVDVPVNTEIKQTRLTRWIDYRLRTAAGADDSVRALKPAVDEAAIVESAEDGSGSAVIRPVKEQGKTRSPSRKPLTGWKLFADAKPALAAALLRYCWQMHLPFPRQADVNESVRHAPILEDWMVILEDYASQCLKLSADKDDHKTFERIKSAARKLGYGITELGLRKQASPVDRVLAFSNAKAQAVTRILEIEYRNLQDRLRAAVVTDFERMSATSVKSLNGVLSEESGGAIAALKTLLASDIGACVNPCLVTGSLLLVDRRICKQFVQAAQEYLAEHGHKFDLIVNEEDTGGEAGGAPFSEITASSSSWESRLYVGLATAIFERGITKCLIGTRGLFGEGWDSQALNTLIDLTTTTSPVSVKQLRGRSIRIQTNDPLGAKKVANNWDVVCIAPALEKGLNDYHRFVRKHDGYFGIADDGQIECGVGHVHPALSELAPVEVFASLEKFNTEMIDRALIREYIYDLWKVGQPYKNQSLGCVELSSLRALALTPPHIRQNVNYKEHAHALQKNLQAIWYEYALLAVGTSIGTALLFHAFAFVGVIPLLGFIFLGRRKYQALFESLKSEVCRPNTQDSSLLDMSTCVLTALQRRRLLPKSIVREQIKISKRRDSAFRVYLDDVDPEQSRVFIQSMKEVLAPVSNQPYLMPKYEYFLPDDEDTKRHGQRENRFFKSYLRGHAEPKIVAYHPVPSLLARSEKGREAFQSAWNKYVSPGFIVETETKPQLIDRYYGLGPSLAQRVLWE